MLVGQMLLASRFFAAISPAPAAIKNSSELKEETRKLSALSLYQQGQPFFMIVMIFPTTP